MFPGLLKQLLYLLISDVLRHGYWNTDLETLSMSIPSHQALLVSSGIAQTSPPPFAGIQGGPRSSLLPTVPHGWPSSLHRRCSRQHVAASPANRKFLCNGGSGYALALQSQIVHGSSFSPVQPGIPSFCAGICHFTAARSSTSCSLFPVGTWLQIILSVLFSTQERALFSHPAAHKRGNQEAGQEFF